MTMPTALARHPVARLRERARLLALRGSFAVEDLLAPDRASARALDLWCTVPSGAGRRKDFRPYPGEVATTTTPAGHDVVTESWGTGPVVYLVHGWGGWRGQLGAFVEPLVAAGHRVVGFDAPGHGESAPGALGTGKGHIMELLAAFDTVAAQHGDAAGVIAHSLGCTIASLVVHDRLDAERLVLVGAPADFGERTHEFGAAVGFTERTRHRLQTTMEQECGRPLTTFDLAPLAAGGGLPETLLIHDRFDKEAPYRVSAELAAVWPTATLLTTLGLGHQRILTDPDVVAAAVRHITSAPRRRTAPPTGASGRRPDDPPRART